jgi:hypothetical protein
MEEVSENRVLTLPLQIVVLNAEISAERRDGNVGNNSAHRINSSTRGRTPYLAAQQWVGILSKQWLGTGPCDRGRAPVNGPYLTGLRASQRSAQLSFAKGHGPAIVNTKLL